MKNYFKSVIEEISVKILIVTEKNPSLGYLTKQSKMFPNIWSGRDMHRYILLTIPDKDCLHSSLCAGPVARFVLGPIPRFVLGPVPGAVPAGPFPRVDPRLVTAPLGPYFLH